MAARPNLSVIAKMNRVIRATSIAQNVLSAVSAPAGMGLPPELPNVRLEGVEFWVQCADGADSAPEPAVHMLHQTTCQGCVLVIRDASAPLTEMDRRFAILVDATNFDPADEATLRGLHDEFLAG